jgi:hypothetical protein
MTETSNPDIPELVKKRGKHVEDDAHAKAKLEQYQRNAQRASVVRVVSYSTATLLGTLLLMMVCGDLFKPFLNMIGLDPFFTETRGIYADCSKASNRNNHFCSGVRREARTEQSWKDISSGGKQVPFSLTR